jgi:hypothetical protein
LAKNGLASLRKSLYGPTAKRNTLYEIPTERHSRIGNRRPNMHLQKDEIQFLCKFLGGTDIKLISTEDIGIAATLHERLQNPATLCISVEERPCFGFEVLVRSTCPAR